MLGATPVPLVRSTRREDLLRARERPGGLAPGYLEPQSTEAAGLWQLLVDKVVQHHAVVHASPVPQYTHLDRHLGCSFEQLPADLVRTLDDVPAELLGAHGMLGSHVPDDFPQCDAARLVAQLLCM